jgi:hypothetical protein
MNQAAAAHAEKQAVRAKGQPAAKWVLALGWLGLLATLYFVPKLGSNWRTNVGGIIACVIGEYYASSRLSDDETHAYDAASRKHGRVLGFLSLAAVVLLALALRFVPSGR